jgi:hypothetical protein
MWPRNALNSAKSVVCRTPLVARDVLVPSSTVTFRHHPLLRRAEPSGTGRRPAAPIEASGLAVCPDLLERLSFRCARVGRRGAGQRWFTDDMLRPRRPRPGVHRSRCPRPASGSGGHAEGSVGVGRVRRTSGSAGGRSLTLRIDRCPAEELAWPGGSARLGRRGVAPLAGSTSAEARGARDRPRSSPPLAPCRCLGNLEMISGVGPAGGGQEAEKIA